MIMDDSHLENTRNFMLHLYYASVVQNVQGEGAIDIAFEAFDNTEITLDQIKELFEEQNVVSFYLLAGLIYGANPIKVFSKIGG